MDQQRLRFGVFMPPYHGQDENPSLALHRDLWLTEWVDKLGFDEMWVGEHHSAGSEIISSPELFIATALERTRNIRFGTGVISLSYHNPLMVAERINYLDHISRGRVMLGVGPGALPSDAFMLGIAQDRLRPRMDESLAVIEPLLRGETVSAETDWFKLDNARLHMDPYTRPRVELVVTSMYSPNGAMVAGKHGIGILSLQALGQAAFKSLAPNWAIAEEMAAKNGKVMDRSSWRVVLQMHLSDTRERALEECRYGLKRFVNYFTDIAGLPILPDDFKSGEDVVEAYASQDVAIIGTPDDAIAAIEDLQAATGGFGCAMLMVHDWADTRATERSYELFARYVMPHFQGLNRNRNASVDWVKAKRGGWSEEVGAANQKAFSRYEEEKAKVS